MNFVLRLGHHRGNSFIAVYAFIIYSAHQSMPSNDSPTYGENPQYGKIL